jgi:hypothetical protein
MDALSAQVSVLEEVAAGRALYELRERQKADKAKAERDAAIRLAKAREDAQGGQAVNVTVPIAPGGGVWIPRCSCFDDEMAF